MAITRGVEAGADEIEIDVRVTKDGVPVLNHNAFIHDSRGNALSYVLVRKQNFKELRTRKPDVTTLEEAVKLVNQRVPLLIEVKPRVHLAPIVKLLEGFLANGWQPKDFLLGSFNQRTLEALHAALPDIEMVVIGAVSGVWSSWRARRLGTKRISLWHRVMWWGFVSSMSKHGYKLCAYSLNDPKKAARWTKRGLYGVITDYPDRFKNDTPKGS